MVRQADATMQPAPQDNHPMSKHRVLSLKPQLRLEWARPGRAKRNRAARSFRQLRWFHHVINSDKVFGTYRGAILQHLTISHSQGVFRSPICTTLLVVRSQYDAHASISLRRFSSASLRRYRLCRR